MEGNFLKKGLLKKQAPISFEDRLFRAFPGSEWISTHSGHIDGQQLDPIQHPGDLSLGAIGVIGGAKFDEADLVKWLRTLPGDAVLVTAAPKYRKDGEPFAGDFGGKLLRLAGEVGLRVDFVSLKNYGTYSKRAQVAELLRATSGDVMVTGTGELQDVIRAIAKDDDWAMVKATLGDRKVVEIA